MKLTYISATIIFTVSSSAIACNPFNGFSGIYKTSSYRCVDRNGNTIDPSGYEINTIQLFSVNECNRLKYHTESVNGSTGNYDLIINSRDMFGNGVSQAGYKTSFSYGGNRSLDKKLFERKADGKILFVSEHELVLPDRNIYELCNFELLLTQ